MVRKRKNLILPSFRQSKKLMNLSRTLVPHADSSHPSSLRVSETNHAISVHCVNIDQADESVVKTVTGLYVPTNPVSDTNTQKVPDIGVCYQCFRNRRTADRPAYIDFVQLTKEQPLSDSSLSSNPREPCHPRLLTQMPLAHAVVRFKNKMILVASPNGCSCRTDNCQCIQTCQHLTSTVSTDSSSVKHVYGSNRDSRRDNWHSMQPSAYQQLNHLSGTSLSQRLHEEQPFGNVWSAPLQSTQSTVTGKSVSSSTRDGATRPLQTQHQSSTGPERPTEHRSEQDARAFWAQTQPLHYPQSFPPMSWCGNAWEST